MLSVVAYGRNDVSGYNAHRRVALSLNCIAEVLVGDTDEIVFVDYNTPDGLPTLPEALGDTLTETCRSRLRVVRVRAAEHTARYAASTPLPIVEPVARNVAARRSNPSNPWLLMTNTDMVLVSTRAPSLTHVCADLGDGFYVTPRFELPEWVWEQLPRSDPTRAMCVLAELGPALRLNEVTTSHDWLRFDSAGDFQLVLRDDFFAIDGFDEAMVLGWHVDANLGKRMLRRRGAIDSLQHEVAGYHCNHLRTASTYQRSEVANDLHRFVVECERAEIPAQRATWGLVDSDLEEIDLSAASSFTTAVLGALGPVTRSPLPTDARDEKWGLSYDSAHVLAHVADALRVARRGSAVAYIGANPVLRELLGALLGGLDGASALVDDPNMAEIVVVDLGADASLTDGALETDTGTRPAELRRALLEAFDAFSRFVEAERAATGAPRQRQIVLVNSAAIYWAAFCESELECGPSTPHSRVRRATVGARPENGDVVQAARARAQRLRRWIVRRDAGLRPLPLEPGDAVQVASMEDYAGFGDGWGFPDSTGGIPVIAPRVELTVATAHASDLRLVASFERADGGRVTPLCELPSLEQSEDGVTHVELELDNQPDGLRLVALELRASGRLRGRLSPAARPTRGAGARHRATGP